MQHKEKIAKEIEHVANAAYANHWAYDQHRNGSLAILRIQAGRATEEKRTILQSSIKGLGKTSIDIFFRRMQWWWSESIPFMDDRDRKAVGPLGLPQDADELVELVCDHWDRLGRIDLDDRKRHAFVTVLERAVGAELENKIDMVLSEASKAFPRDPTF